MRNQQDFMIRRDLYTMAMLLCVIVILPFHLLKEGSETAIYLSDYHFVFVEMSLSLFAINRFIETKHPYNILLIVAFGTVSIIDLLNKFFDKSINNFYPVAIITTTALICSIITFIISLRPKQH